MHTEQHITTGVELQAQKLAAVECNVLQGYITEASTSKIAVLEQAFSETPPGYIGAGEIEVTELILLEFLLPNQVIWQSSI